MLQIMTVAAEAEIIYLHTAGSFRRRGLGAYLLYRTLEELSSRGIQSMFLEVRKSNQAAIALYKRLGFLLFGERQRYYADGESALLMKRTM